MEKKGEVPEINKKNRDKWNQLRFETKQLRAGEDPFPETSHSIRPPIYAAKSYTYSSMTEMLKHQYFYSRTENPTLFALDQKLSTLHGGEQAVSVASGMAAIHLACSSVLQKRIERISPKKIRNLLPQANPEKIPNMIIHTNLYTGAYRLFTKFTGNKGDSRITRQHLLNKLESSVTEILRTKFTDIGILSEECDRRVPPDYYIPIPGLDNRPSENGYSRDPYKTLPHIKKKL